MKEAIENIISNPTSMNPSAALSINVMALEWVNYVYLLRNNLLPIFFLGKTPNYADPIDYVIPILKTTT